MGSVTDYLESALLAHVVNAVTYTPASTIYLALCTADPTDTATGASMNEVSNANAYARVAITLGAAAARRVTQSGAVTFPTPTGSWGTITHWAIVTNGTYGSGNVLATGAFSPTKAITTGQVPFVATAILYVEFSAGSTAGISDYLANKLLDFAFRNVAYTTPATYLAASTATLTDASTSPTEPSGNAYARLIVNPSSGASPKWSAVASGAVTNANDTDFVAATGSWGTITTLAVMDALTTGNLLFYDNGVTDNAILSGDVYGVAAGQLSITVT